MGKKSLRRFCGCIAAVYLLTAASVWAQGGPPPQIITAVTPNAAHPGASGLVVVLSLVGTTPPTPPANIVPSAVRIGANLGTAVRRDAFTVSAVFDLPADAPAATLPVSVEFPAPPGQANPQIFTLNNGFTIGDPPVNPGALQPAPAPPGNPLTESKALLGKALFWDEQLSSTRTVACGSCHDFAAGGVDVRARFANALARHPGPDNIFGTGDDGVGSPGVPLNLADGSYAWASAFGLAEQVTPRTAMPVLMAPFFNELFWDGRAEGAFVDPVSGQTVLAAGAALESQVLAPPLSSVEMAHTERDWPAVAVQIAGSVPLALSPQVPGALDGWIGGRSYPALFEDAFGTPEVTPARIAMAIASYERTLVPNQAPVDLGEPLTPAELRGQGVFNASRCNVCHGGPRFSDGRFHYTGVRPVAEDLGRFEVTGDPRDRGAMRSPSLRNVAQRGAFMRNGRFATLEEVIDFYDRGGDFDAPNKDANVRPLGLSPQQKADLAAFMRRPLTDPRVLNREAPFDAPQLYRTSILAPRLVAPGSAPGTGPTPAIVAIEPPLLGNDNLSFGVVGAVAGAAGALVLDSQDPGLGPLPTAPFYRSDFVVLAPTGDGGGYGSASLALPDDPALIGQTLFARWYVVDAGGLSVSPLVEFTIFGPGGVLTPPIEGEGEIVVVERPHSADSDANGRIGLTELLRVVQFFNAGSYHCAPPDYAAGPGASDCTPHASDFAPADFAIGLPELLRLIQFFNAGAYHACSDSASIDGYCPGG